MQDYFLTLSLDKKLFSMLPSLLTLHLGADFSSTQISLSEVKFMFELALLLQLNTTTVEVEVPPVLPQVVEILPQQSLEAKKDDPPPKPPHRGSGRREIVNFNFEVLKAILQIISAVAGS